MKLPGVSGSASGSGYRGAIGSDGSVSNGSDGFLVHADRGHAGGGIDVCGEASTVNAVGAAIVAADAGPAGSTNLSIAPSGRRLGSHVMGRLPSRLSWYQGAMRRGESPLGLLTIQPTPFCNINCSYCYLPDRSDRSVFDLSLLDPLLNKLQKSGLLGRRLAISWHAGEPLVLPASYYRDAIERIEGMKLGVDVRHNFQTNGTLINEEYCALFSRPDVEVALSMDGPGFLHDSRRKTRSGAGTHAKAMEGLQRLKAHKIRYSAIAVITHDSLPYPDEIYDFFKDNEFSGLGINIDELEGANAKTSLGVEESEKSFVTFFSRLIWRATRDGNPRWIREFDQHLHHVGDVIHNSSSVSSECNPLSLLTVDVKGRLYTFSPELAGMNSGAFSFGHVLDCDFTSLWSNPKFVDLNRRIQNGVKLCADSCEYFGVCGGGAPINKFFENKTFESTETVFCHFKKKLTYDIVEDFILRKLSNQRGQRLGSRASKKIEQ
jgi:uncharacterized protein